jgi:hypothetical protein
VVGRKADWATAWPPGPAADEARTLRPRSAWSPRGPRAGRRGGTLASSPVTASRWHGLGLEHHDYAADAPGKESGGRAHRGGGTTTGRSGSSAWQRAAASLPEGGSAATLASSGSCRGGRGR